MQWALGYRSQNWSSMLAIASLPIYSQSSKMETMHPFTFFNCLLIFAVSFAHYMNLTSATFVIYPNANNRGEIIITSIWPIRLLHSWLVHLLSLLSCAPPPPPITTIYVKIVCILVAKIKNVHALICMTCT